MSSVFAVEAMIISGTTQTQAKRNEQLQLYSHFSVPSDRTTTELRTSCLLNPLTAWIVRAL